MKTLLITAIFMFIAATVHGADKTLSWDASDNAEGYKIQMSTDMGQTWDAGVDVGNVTSYLYTGIPDTGLVLFRVVAYNSQTEAVRYEYGAWYCGDWLPPDAVSGIGMK